MRHLILHIGHYGTGTAALQEALTRSRGALLEEGVLYPEEGAPMPGHFGHSEIAFEVLASMGARVPFWYRRLGRLEEFEHGAPSAAGRVREEIEEMVADTVILSSEEFIRFGIDGGVPADETRRLIDGFAPEKVTVACYLRRPDRHLTSWYIQLVKMGRTDQRLADDVERFLGTEHVEYDRALRYWKSEVGVDTLVVRDYDRLRPRTITEGFGDLFGLPLAPAAQDGAVNEHVDSNFVEYVRVHSFSRSDEPEPELLDLLRRIGTDDRLPPLMPVDVLGPAARQRLFTCFSPVNERLGTLASSGGPFFSDLEDMLEPPSDSITDLEAYQFWAPHVDAALHAVRET